AQRSEHARSCNASARLGAASQPLRWQGRLTFGGDFYDFRARVWSPELGSFLQPDEFGYVTPTGTLWSWPGQNPYRWRDPYGRFGMEDVNNGLFWLEDNGYLEGAQNAALLTSAIAATIATGGAAGQLLGLGTLEGALGSAGAAALGLGRAAAATGGGAAAALLGGAKGCASGGVNNPIPARLARVIPGNVTPATLGRPGTSDVFVTAADDIVGLNAAQLSQRLAIPPSQTFTVFEFATPAQGLASPILRSNPGFIGHGLTGGGAREFVLPNGPIPVDAARRLVGQ
ncbi:MAG TPA: polymorphic toxin type 10 domain-containing protein, partial [Polyangiaceae bacterium]